MRRISSSASRKPGRLASFTLIELLTVIAIIAILTGLTLAAYTGVMNSSGRSRARAEIAALSAALENYKSDNGIYPAAAVMGNTNAYTSALPNSSQGLYQQASELLFQALSGQTNYTDLPNGKSYYPFKKAQLGNDSATAGEPIYVKDPFGNSYGYFTGSGAAVPYTGSNFFDLWSTAGDTAGTNAPRWIDNWGQ